MVKKRGTKKLILLFSLTFTILIISSFVSATEDATKGTIITGKSIINKFNYTPNDTEIKSPITGNLVFSAKPNELQRIYSKSLPSVAKINVYYNYDVFVPKLNSINFGYNFDYYYPSYDDLNVRMDKDINGFESFFGDSFWDDFYVGEYYGEDELGNSYIYEMKTVDIDKMKEEFQRYHNGSIPLVSGTGFLIDSQGYILTNAHVATLVESEIEKGSEDIAFYYYLYYYYLLYNNANYNEEISMDKYEGYLKKTLFLEENLKIKNLKISKIEVILGEGPNAKKYEAKLIDSNENYLDEVGGRDWALLKIEGNNFPSLELGDSDTIPIGDNLVVIGYPWTSEGFTDEEVYVAPTPTYGKISNIVPSGKYKDIQIDISIEGGNSGGPALDQENKVIGIATSGYDSLGGTYNYLTPINDVKKELSIAPKQSEVDSLWNEGLENFWEENYANARFNFEEIVSINPDYPYIQEIIKQLDLLPNTNKEIESTNSKSQDKKENNISTITIIFIILGVAIIILLSFIAFHLFKNDKRKKIKN